LLALYDCCLDNAHHEAIAPDLPNQLLHKAHIDPNELLQQQEARRIQKLIAELSAPEEEFRIEAAIKLSQRGAPATLAEPELVGMLANPNQTSPPARPPPALWASSALAQPPC
jgi:hypothetical protein